MVDNKKNSYANRGIDLEEKIINICEKYKKENIAYIVKIPTDWCVIRKYNPKTKKAI